ncbi:hypothetical protein WMY93_004049 [Mugilogobius chulae]|uniref:V-SNARE coiled-coil homology domain-containing protein n=1 Tax=Mugilogobius chulae TaxID=88201 RepID=A0AAW0PR89_9GOBI
MPQSSVWGIQSRNCHFAAYKYSRDEERGAGYNRESSGCATGPKSIRVEDWVTSFPRTDLLTSQGTQIGISKAFEKTTVKVKQQKQWQNYKMKIIFVAIGIAVGAIIIGIIVYFSVQNTQN